MFNQYSQVMMSEVNYRHDLYKQEVQRERQVRQANQYSESKPQSANKVPAVIKNGRLSMQKGL
ncbi:MAG: hypothetical protein J0I20_06220 [Chloroflexi bacterium]|nr:hypothetical protein [Chloroflexota bacterium]OJV90189.1 MAG: hypothetical protein BGO39_02160 [Chloroflexi bacterium 54-19]